MMRDGGRGALIDCDAAPRMIVEEDAEGMHMARTIVAIFDGEVLRPAEPLDLTPNTEYRVTIEETEPSADDARHPLAKFAAFVIEDLDIPDLAEQHDHYLYGTPKR